MSKAKKNKRRLRVNSMIAIEKLKIALSIEYE
jgi:hypothetical protein